MCADREETADRILENLEDAERLSRYYGILSDRNQRVHLILSLTTILLSVGAGVTLLTNLPDISAVLVFMLVASATAIMLVFDHSRRATIARLVSEEMRRVTVDLRDLWVIRRTANIPDLHEKLSQMESKINASTGVELLIDYKLNAQCAEEADQIVHSQYRGKEGQGGLASETT